MRPARAGAGASVGAGLLLLLTVLTTAAPGAAEERVRFQSLTGETIDALFVPSSQGARAPWPTVMMLHGCAGLFTNSGELKARPAQWRDILSAEGWAVLLPDSFGPRGVRRICNQKDRAITPGGQRQFDAAGAFQYLLGRADVDAKRIALVGWSNGAMTGLKVIRDGGQVAPRPGGADFRTAVLFYPGCIAEARENPRYTARVPTLIQHGELDDWTLAKPCRKLVRTANAVGGAPMFIDVYPGAYHAFDHPNLGVRTVKASSRTRPSGERDVHVGTHPEAREKAIRRTLDWLRAHLGTD